MRGLVICLLVIAILTSYSGLNPPKSQSGRDEVKEQKQLEGAYEFVSESLELTKPRATTERISPPAWTGLWFFQSGHFSQTMMKNGRGYLTYPSSHADVGFESSAGTYAVDGPILRLERDLSLHPLSVGRTITLEYHFEGDKIILLEMMHPYTENVAEGKRTIVLRRIE